MNSFATIINYLLPLLGALLLFSGALKKNILFVVAALWLSLLALILQYQLAGGEILGSYFNYNKAAIYTLTLLILVVSLAYLCKHLSCFHEKIPRAIAALTAAMAVTGGALLIINIWINAYFISERLPGTPIIQVGTFTPSEFCSYRYIFYKVSKNSKIKYLCPNHYGLIPSTGEVTVAPELIIKQLINPSLKKTRLDGTNEEVN